MEIKLSQGRVAIVDEIDYEYLNQFKWYFKSEYAVRNDYINGIRTTVRMHRIIMNCTESICEVDHIDFNKLNNRRYNLRICTRSENMINKIKSGLYSSNYKGVSFNKDKNKYIARVKKNGKSIFLGLFESEIEAALAYDRAAKNLFGEYAYLNFF